MHKILYDLGFSSIIEEIVSVREEAEMREDFFDEDSEEDSDAAPLEESLDEDSEAR